ncbi:amino acid permease [uncultured Clostridium sp.]|uniref:amino acid permease n=1 Tax=uncultured Clostridium sp. TaxID=59620 RepID=UPI002628AAA1|nr:amino acid permease [uncultured Clostridium sp.]
MTKATQDSKKNVTYKISTWGFISMSILTVYGVMNGQQMYYQMGYQAITYVLIATVLFFIPYSFAVAEMGSAFSDKKGGIYSWLSEIIGEKYALSTTLIWFSSQFLGGLAISAICIKFSTMLYGKDISETWHFFGLSNQMSTTLIGIVWVLFWIFIATKGVKSIEVLTKISMLLFFYNNIFTIVVSLWVFFKNKMHFAQPLHWHGISTLFVGPNPDYRSIFSMLGFMVFAIMIFGGMESASGLVDEVENPRKTVPKGIFITVVVIFVLTIVMIVGSGMVLNWNQVYNNPNVNLVNFTVYLGLKYYSSLGLALGMSAVHAAAFAKWYMIFYSWIAALSFLQLPLNYYFPIKQLIEGLPKGMLPDAVTRKNKHNVPANALWLLGLFLCGGSLIIVLIFGNNANQIYNYTTFMVTVASVIPWGLITFAYIKFKKNDNIKKHYKFFGKKVGIIYNSISLLVIIFAVVFSLIQPWTQPGGAEQGILMIFGPVLFGLIGFFIARRYQKVHKNNES